MEEIEKVVCDCDCASCAGGNCEGCYYESLYPDTGVPPCPNRTSVARPLPCEPLYPNCPPLPTQGEIDAYNAYIAEVRANFPTHTVIYASPELDGRVTVERWSGWPSNPPRWTVQAWRREIHSGLRLFRFLCGQGIQIAPKVKPLDMSIMDVLES
jgi:hypothetical protein